MDDLNFKYRMPLSQTNNLSNFHFYKNISDNEINKNNKDKQFHSFSKNPEIEEEYQNITDEKNILKKNSIINLTSEELKKEYIEKYNYYYNGLQYLFIISILLIISSFIEIKYLIPSVSNIILLIMSCLSTGFCFMLLVNIKGKVLVDTYGYAGFYLFSIIESTLFLCLFIYKIINIIIIFQQLNSNLCLSKFKCPGYFVYLLLLILTIVIFFGVILNIRFVLTLLLDGYNILILKQKTLFQRQIEINERKYKGKKIEFIDENDESMNNSINSLNQLNSNDILKTE